MNPDNAVAPTVVTADPRPLLDTEAQVLAVPVWPGDDVAGPWIGAGGADLVETLGLDLFSALERDRASGKAGEIVSVPVFAEGRGAGSPDGDVDVHKVLLVGLGDGSAAAHRKAGAALARAARGVERLATTAVSTADDAALRAFVEGAVLATFGVGRFRTRPADPSTSPLGTLVLAGDRAGESAEELGRATAVAAAVWLARDLIHTPSNVKDPEWLAEQARRVGREAGVDVRVRDEKALAAEGFGGIVAVGMGSVRPPRLIALRYEPPHVGHDTPHVVLVGKGITFDTGGLSLKPREAMLAMKTDMSGGAVVIGVLSALRELGVPVRVTGLVAAAENAPGAAAQRPGDVIRQYDGTSVEVINTDAEGRLVLADAIGYAVAELDPSVVVDVATLTGAATVGLGRTHAALYATDDVLADALVRAGARAGEQLWRMPLVPDYRASLRSSVADVAHVETTAMGGGSITAALFLERFAGTVPWAHLDIAGPGRADADRDDVVKGGTAFTTRALLYWLESWDQVG